MGALDGVRVVELGQVIAGTYGTQYLADYGADVIKVEPPRGDLGRNPVVGDLGGESSLFVAMNRNKRSVVLDLKQPAGLAVFYDLVRTADVVLENFRPGVVEKLGVDEATLRAINPRLIYASVSGFGPADPRRDAPSFDLIHQALSGLMSVTGEPGRTPCPVGVPVADLLSGFFLTHGVLAALYARERTGQGQRVETAMLDVMLSLLSYQAAMYLNRGVVPTRLGSAHEYHVPWQAFATRDRYVVIAPREQWFWRALCRAVERPELVDDPRFATNQARREHREALIAILEAVLRTRTAAEWLAIFEREGVPAAPVRDVGEALSDSAVAARGMIVPLDYAPTGPVQVLANPIRLSATPIDAYAPPPTLGEHTADVLRDLLGYADEHIVQLEASGAIARGPLPAADAAADER
jgi:crotonobetainyl-CoA:carnitine CoA-transferase CaiB-like acyl-CoA transferase